MKSVSSYLNFPGTCEEAFIAYAEIFGATSKGFMRFGDMPGDAPEMPDDIKRQVMNTEIELPNGYVIRGSDVTPLFGGKIELGNNMTICLDPDTRADADRMFAALAEGGQVTMPLEEQFWGGYFGQVTDKWGIQWMFNCTAK